MSETLYRKYRPKNFDELTGQNHIKITLQNQLESDKIAHAYLFTGPRGVGKTTTARLLATAVNCPDFKDCESILEGRDLDVIEIDAASNSGVDNVRENIIENSRFTPNFRKYKVFIIDEVHMLSIAAFNALLKILEEPPKHTIFILATTELHKVPVTIVSRCQRFDFKKISTSVMVERLTTMAAAEKVLVDSEVLEEIARLSEGSLRDAESLLGQILALGDKKITMDQARIVIPASNISSVFELLTAISENNTERGIIILNELVDNGIDINQFTVELLEVLRILLVAKFSKGIQDHQLLSEEQQKQVVALTEVFDHSELVRMIDLFAKKRLDIKTSILAQLPLELAVVECTTKNVAQPVEVKQIVMDEKKTLNDNSTYNITDNEEKTVEINEIVAQNSVESVVNLNQTTGVDNEPEVVVVIDSSVDEIDITVEGIKKRWTELLVKLQDGNPSLVLILKTAEPIKMSKGILTIGYKYPFHQDRMKSGDNTDVLQNVFQTVYGHAIKVEHTVLPSDYTSEFIAEVTKQDEVELLADAFVAENASSMVQNAGGGTEVSMEPQTQDQLIQNLVQAFGGKIVE